MANTFYVSIKGSKQGDIKGDTGKTPTNIPILGFVMEVNSPHDPATGQASGRRQWKPIQITKEWGPTSPQLMTALVTNENLTSVVIDEARTDPKGVESVYMEIRLTNASISDILVKPPDGQGQAAAATDEIEIFVLTFQKIEIENKLSNTTAADDWVARV